jgi:hypothetical protein
VDGRMAWQKGDGQKGGGGAGKAAAQAQEAPPAPPASAPAAPSDSPAAATTPPAQNKGERPWPILAEMDGGRTVRRLQLALTEAGFHCGEDEMQWWQFGQTTLESLRTFQACGGLAETGVTCVRTWRLLLGEDARPEDLEKSPSSSDGEGGDDAFADDLGKIASSEGRVWLLGEQRWSRPIEKQAD